MIEQAVLFERGTADRERMIAVDWSERETDVYRAAITIIAQDRCGLLSDISAAVSLRGIAINGVHVDTDKRRNVATLRLCLEVKDYRQLSEVMDKISHLQSVIDVLRDDG